MIYNSKNQASKSLNINKKLLDNAVIIDEKYKISILN